MNLVFSELAPHYIPVGQDLRVPYNAKNTGTAQVTVTEKQVVPRQEATTATATATTTEKHRVKVLAGEGGNNTKGANFADSTGGVKVAMNDEKAGMVSDKRKHLLDIFGFERTETPR